MKSSYTDSLAHTTFECKYHIVFAPKFRRKEIYGKLKQEIGMILSKNDKIRMYEKSKITMYKHTFFFVYFFRRYTENEKINYTIKDIKRNEFKTKLFSFS